MDLAIKCGRHYYFTNELLMTLKKNPFPNSDQISGEFESIPVLSNV